MMSFLFSIVLGLASSNATAEVQFPDPSGIYRGLCDNGLGDHQECDLYRNTRFAEAPNCPDTLFIRTTGFAPSGSNGPTVQVAGQWLACNYYHPSKYIVETDSCRPQYGVPFKHVSTSNYVFDAAINWQSNFIGLSSPAQMDLVRPSVVAGQSSFLAPVRVQAGNVVLFSVGTRDEPAQVSSVKSDWEDGTTYSLVDQFGPREVGWGGCTESSFENATSFFLWERTGGGTPDLARADLSGNLTSGLPAIASEVGRATIILYSQPDGPVRTDQLGGETDKEFREYLDDNLTQVDSIDLTNDENGDYVPFGEPGKFEFPSLPLMKRSGSVGGRELYREQIYALEIINARTDIVTQNQDGTTDTTFRSFDPKIVTNLRLDPNPYNIELLPYEGPIPVKRTIALELAEMCEAYNIPETEVITYLNNLESGVIATTPALEEGVERAILAERSVSFSSKLAFESISELYDTLAGLVGDLISEINFGAENKLADASAAFDKLQAQKEKSGSFFQNISIAELEAHMGKRGQAYNFKQGQLAGGLDKAISLAAPYLTSELIKRGVDEVRARRITTMVTKGVIGVQLKMVEAGAFNKKAVAKVIVAEVIKTLGDDTKAEVCFLLKDDLTHASEQMRIWNIRDDAEFKKTRREIYQSLSEISALYATARAEAGFSKELAGGFDNVENVFGILGVVWKPARAVEEGSKLAKYSLNLRALITDVAASFAAVAGAEKLVSNAFNNKPSTPESNKLYGNLHKASAVPTLATASIPDLGPDIQTLESRMDSVITALDGPDLQAAVDAMFVGSNSLIATIDDWQQKLDQLNLELSGIDANNVGADQAIDSFLDKGQEYDFFLKSLDKLVVEYLDAVSAADDVGQSTSSYRAARDKLVTALKFAREQVVSLEGDLGSLNAWVSSITAGAIKPAVHVSLESIRSNSTGLDEITQSPETFTISVRLKNLSDADLDGLPVNLLVSPSDDVTFETMQTQTIPVLSADGSGVGSEVIVAWEITYGGNLEESNLKMLYANLREDGDVPTSFVSNAAISLWHVDPKIYDTDLDGFSDTFEVANGMDPNSITVNADVDNDGLSNDEEARLGTDIALSDSDGDGLDDYSEVYGAETGFITDPLASDTDNDGVADLADPAPIDAFATEPTLSLNPSPGALEIDQTTVVLSEADTFGGINVTQVGGDGELLWRAEVQDPGLFQLNMGPGDAQQSPGVLFVAARGNSVDYSRNVRSRVLIETVGQPANSRVWVDVMYEGAATSGAADTDGDGVSDDADLCPSTPVSATVDVNGCAASQLDDDNDGVSNDEDLCPGTAAGATVDGNGCAQNQLDDDNDGVSNDLDACPETPAGSAVDGDGCGQSQLDDDSDGVSNDVDTCPATSAGLSVDVNGCAQNQLDDDNDGVTNDIDACPGTPAGQTVNSAGCAPSSPDDDPVEDDNDSGGGSVGPLLSLLLLLSFVARLRSRYRKVRGYNPGNPRSVECVTKEPGRSRGFSMNPAQTRQKTCCHSFTRS